MNSAFFKTARAALAAALCCTAAPACAAGPNLVLIGWDTLRADRVGALGCARPTTPNLDALAARSFLFTNAVAQASWTLPSFMSVFTGLYPSEHQVTNKFLPPAEGGTELEPASLSTGIVTMAELLKSGGYRTAAFTGGAGLGGSFGFSRGFDVYVDSKDFAGFGETFPQALNWLKKNKAEPYFLFVHGYDTHPFHDLAPAAETAFLAPEQAGKALKLRPRHEKLRSDLIDGRKLEYTGEDVKLWNDAYDEKVARADRLLGNFLRELEGLTSTDTVIILLSDHGEELFDHGGVDHGMTLYDEVLRVPLLVHVPGLPGVKVSRQVSLIDVFPTVAQLAGLKPPRAPRGTGLLGAGAAGEDAFAETDYLFHFSKKALRKSSGLKFISDGFTRQHEFYDTAADPPEKNDLFPSEPARAYVLETELFMWESDTARTYQ